MISRRDLMKLTGQTCLTAACSPLASALVSLDVPTESGSLRCLNVINFIRGVEPRGPVDLMLPVRKQMEIMLKEGLPATWLLQFDALVAGPFVAYLKANMARDHEVGFWFEMNEMHCKAAGVEWRGRPGYEWDHYPSVAFTIGYTPEERIKLADTAMREFKAVWGRYPKSIASWNLDSITMAHLSEHYDVDAFAVCRDQIATDGFTIWGAPFAGYYPSRSNCWSPALDRKSQISTPVFKMLGQDPVYYYDRAYKLPGGKRVGGPDTMEPVWTSGRTPIFIKRFLEMIAESPTLGFAYAQLGQENSFGWPEMAVAYPLQMTALKALRASGSAHVETMGESGRRFKRKYSTTPTQAQVMLEDPFGDTAAPEGSIWFQSRYYRANLHLKGGLAFLRDLTVYSDHNPQPFLTKATRAHDVEQRMPAVLDGYHWSRNPGSYSEEGAGGYFEIAGRRVRLAGKPVVREEGKNLSVELPLEGGRTLKVRFEERTIVFNLSGSNLNGWGISFEWDPEKATLIEVQPQRVDYRWQGFEYSVKVEKGQATASSNGWNLAANRDEIRLSLSQPS